MARSDSSPRLKDDRVAEPIEAPDQESLDRLPMALVEVVRAPIFVDAGRISQLV